MNNATIELTAGSKLVKHNGKTYLVIVEKL